MAMPTVSVDEQLTSPWSDDWIYYYRVTVADIHKNNFSVYKLCHTVHTVLTQSILYWFKFVTNVIIKCSLFQVIKHIFLTYMICRHIICFRGSEFCDILLGGLGFVTERDRRGGSKSPTFSVTYFMNSPIVYNCMTHEYFYMRRIPSKGGNY